jgi:RNA polymerase sigma-70 factor (sigma-E family)
MSSADDDFSEYATAAWPALYRRAYLLAGQHADAEDIAQQTLIRVQQHWSKVLKADSVDAYVLRMLTNVFLSSRRPARVSRELLTAVPELVSQASADSRGELWPHICTLPDRQRAVMVLRFYEDLSEREIADVLGVTTGTVKSTAHKALANLRKALGREFA